MTNKYDSENNRDRTETPSNRYAAFDDGDGRTVVFDTRNADAWLKSDEAVDADEIA